MNRVVQENDCVNYTPGGYFISVTSSGGGLVTAPVYIAKKDDEIVLTITPDPGYVLQSLECNGVDIMSSGSFIMPAENAVVTAVFYADLTILHNITIVQSANGIISCDIDAACAEEPVEIHVLPNVGYRLKTLIVNGTAVSNPFAMPAVDAVVTVEFERLPANYFSIRVGTVIGGGSIFVEKTEAQMGDRVSINAVPDDGCRLKPGSLKANDIVITGDTFIMPSQDVTIIAEFESVTNAAYAVTYDANAPRGKTATGTPPMDNNMYEQDDVVTVLGQGSLHGIMLMHL